MEDSREFEDLLKQLYWEEKLSLAQISKRIGVPYETIRVFMKKKHIQLRPKSCKGRRLYKNKRKRLLETLEKYGVKDV